MTKVRSQQLTGNALCQPDSPNIAGGEEVDACELLLAELRARRLRLQRLLHLVCMDAEGLPARCAPAGSRARCGNGRLKRSA
jgi:hypothetical protein